MMSLETTTSERNRARKETTVETGVMLLIYSTDYGEGGDVI